MTRCLPSKRTRSDPEAFRNQTVLAVKTSVQPECLIRIPASDSVSVFPKAWIKLLQNRPGSDQDVLVRVWPNTSGQEASWCAGNIGPCFWQDATGPIPVSHFQTQLRSSSEVPDRIVQNQPGSHLVLADCVRVWPKGSGPEASRGQ